MAENIYQRIAAVMQDVSYLTKDDRVETGGGKGYRAISEEKVTSTIRASLIKNGIVIVPIRQEHARTDETVTDKYGNPKTNRMTTVNVTYRIQNTEDSTDYIEAVSSGTGVDTQDKGVGKAMTYAYKYLLLRTFAIPTGDDPDKVSSDLYTAGLYESPFGAAGKGVKYKAEEPHALTCDKCGGEIAGIKYQGKLVAPQEQADRWGLCKSCIMEAAKSGA